MCTFLCVSLTHFLPPTLATLSNICFQSSIVFRPKRILINTNMSRLHIQTCTCTFICTNTYTFISTTMHISICTHLNIQIRPIYIYQHVRTYLYVQFYVRICTCQYEHIHISIPASATGCVRVYCSVRLSPTPF